MASKKGKKHYRWEKKVEVVTAYLALGNVPAVQAATGVPFNTIHYWKKMDWWKELVAEIQESEDLELNAKLKGVVEKSLHVVQDRLENGDFQYDPKTGQMVRKPVSMKDAAKVQADAQAQRVILRDIHQRPTLSNESVAENLKKIALTFEQLAKTQKKVVAVPSQLIEGKVSYVESE